MRAVAMLLVLAVAGCTRSVSGADPGAIVRFSVTPGIESVLVSWEELPEEGSYDVEWSESGPPTETGRNRVESSPTLLRDVPAGVDVQVWISFRPDGGKREGPATAPLTVRALPRLAFEAAETWSYTTGTNLNYGRVIAAGDANRDGRADVAIAGPKSNGCYDLFHGRDGGLAGAADASGCGLTNEAFGAAVVSADFDGDGYDDLAMGAPGALGGVGDGAFDLFRGGPFGWQFEETRLSPDAGVRFGEALSAGDANGDGFDDLLVGESGSSGENGRVRLYLGDAAGLATSASWSYDSPDDSDGTGTACALTDLDGDLLADIAVGRPESAGGAGTDAGSVLVFRGVAGTGPLPADTPVATFDGSEADQRFGARLAAAGDLDGDGVGDLAVSDRLQAGKQVSLARVVPQPRLDVIFAGQPEGVGLPLAPTAIAVGDLDFDGVGDLLVGDPEEGVGGSNEAGAIYFLFGGSPVVVDSAMTIRGSGVGQLGGGLAFADVDGDGVRDLLAGEPKYPSNSGDGRVRLFPGVPAQGPRVNAGMVLSSVYDPGDGRVAPAGATFQDVVRTAQHRCTWTWWDGEQSVVDPCTPETAGAVSREGLDEETGTYPAILRVEADDGRFGESLTTIHLRKRP